MAELETGLYGILEAGDTAKCLGVVGWSSDSGANVREHTYSRTEGQICYVSHEEGGYVINFPLTGNVLCVADKGAGVGKWYVGGAFNTADTSTDEYINSAVQSQTGDATINVGDVYLNWNRLTTYRCVLAGKYNTAKWTYAGDASNGFNGLDAPSHTWHVGNGINGANANPKKYESSGVANANVGDIYFNDVIASVYVCDVAGNAKTAKWHYVSNIQYARTRTDDGTNVYQHDWDGTTAEYWDIEDASGSAVYDGETYSKYLIITQLDNNKVLDINASGNAVIMNRTGAQKKEFIFVPIDMAPEGTYRIVPQVDKTVCLGVQSNSDELDKWLVHTSINDNDYCNYQVFKLDQLDNGVCSLRLPDGRALRCKASNSRRYASAGQWDASDEELWVTKGLGSTSFNGSAVPTYHIATVAENNNYVLDAFGYANSTGTEEGTSLHKYVPIMQGYQSRSRQRYLLVPAEGYASTGVTVPSNPELYLNGEHSTLLGANEPCYVYPCWQGSNESEEWQVRYCYQYRVVGDSAYAAKDCKNPVSNGTWTPWYSLGNGSTANNGWGEPGQANCTATYNDGWWVADQPIDIRWIHGTKAKWYDGYHIEFQVRQVVHEYGELGIDAHSGKATGWCWVCYKPTPVFGSGGTITVTPEGITLPYTSDFTRGYQNITLLSNNLFGKISADKKSHTGSILIPSLKRIPRDGEELALEWEITANSEVTNSGTQLVTVNCDMRSAPVMTVVEAWAEKTKVLRIEFPASAITVRMWMEIDGEDELIECDGTGNKYRYCYYPLNKPWTLEAYAIIGGVVYRWTNSYSIQSSRSRIFNWGTTYQTLYHCLELEYDLGTPPQENIKTAPSAQTRMTTTRKWGLTQVGTSYNQDRSITAALVDDLYEDALAVIDEFSQCRFSWYRNPEGEVVRVAVTNVTVSETQKGVHRLSISIKRVDA